MDRLLHWLKRPLDLPAGDEDGGHAVEYSLIVAAASALLAHALMPATAGVASSIAGVLADWLPRALG